MNKPPNGSAVKYFHVIPQTKDHPAGIASYDAIVLGFESQAEDAKGLPAASLAFFNPDKSIHLSGAEWAHSFERVDSVPHADETRFSWYEVAQSPKDETSDLRDFLLSNFKSETGDETPVHCAIRLLAKLQPKKPAKAEAGSDAKK